MYKTFLCKGDNEKTGRRTVKKNGNCNVLYSKISEHRIKFLHDLFTTLVDIQWTWTLIIFALSFLFSWLMFGFLWWIIALEHGDLQENHLPNEQQKSGWTPCVTQIRSFASSFLFSIETQQTIGYGSRTITDECPEAILLIYLQCIFGVAIQALMVGIIFAKTVKPTSRTHSIIFSKNGVICQRDGYLYLMFRIGHMRKSHIISAKINAYLIRTKTTSEGERIQQYQTELSVKADECNKNILFIWPMIIMHKIDENSPLFGLSTSEVQLDSCEIIVVLEGTIESTGRSTQARSSYLLSEILWSHQFVSIVSYDHQRRKYRVDYSKFDETILVETPPTAGSSLIEFYKLQEREELD